MDSESSELLRLEYQAAWENYRHIFSLRFELLKYLFSVSFAVLAAIPVILSYVQSRGIGIRTSYPALLLLVVVPCLLGLLTLLAYGILANWNLALAKHGNTIQAVRSHIYGFCSGLRGSFGVFGSRIR